MRQQPSCHPHHHHLIHQQAQRFITSSNRLNRHLKFQGNEHNLYRFRFILPFFFCAPNFPPSLRYCLPACHQQQQQQQHHQQQNPTDNTQKNYFP